LAIEIGSTDSIGTDAGLKYLHPSISSTIRSEEISYQGGAGLLSKLAIFTSEKGEDNKVVRFTSADEFIAKTGQPNLKKYGQTAYNAVNWLNAGGEVFGLRVMPENAGYSHAFLNILTKVESKSVRDKDGNAVTLPNVVLKPAIAYTDINNASESLLGYELTKERTEETIDGFKNHLLFAIHPKGRGKAYNNLGFRITLNTSYDEVYDFRVYNFEVIRFDEYGTANVLEGPFYVSLSPDAMSSSNESMFIEDVINKYSQHVKCLFNEKAFAELAYLINPHVNPFRIDPLTGVTRTVRGETDLFFSNVTGKFEDVHITLQDYDASGNPITDATENPKRNIVDASDVIEQSILMADNTYRKNIYDRYLKNIDYMKQVFNSISSNNYNQLITELLYTPDGVTPESGLIPALVEKLNGYHVTIENLVNVFNTSKLESDFNRLVTENKLVEQGIRDIMELIVQLLSYHKAIEMNADVLDIDEKVNQVFNKLNLKEIIDIRAISKKDLINDISNRILELKASGDADAQVTSLAEILSEVKTAIDYLLLIINENGLSATEINLAVDEYNVIIDLYNAIFDPYLSAEIVNGLIAEIYSRLDQLTATLYGVTELAIANIDLFIIDDVITGKIANIVNDLLPLTYGNTTLFATKLSTTEGRNELLSGIRKNIENQSAVVTVMKSIVYTNQLQDFNSPVAFMNGSDGDLDENNPTLRNITEQKLLVQAFKGLIDSTITNRKLTPYQFILDGNYSVDVKNAIVTLVRDIRKDIFFYADSGLLASPEDAINWRTTAFNVSSQFLGIYTQDFVVFDEFNGKDIKVTPTFFLASKIPANAGQFGLQYPIAGNRRGTIDGHKAISYVPNESYKELFYNRQLNYVEADTKRTRFGSQLTADMKRTPLSDINNVLTALDIKRNVEEMAEDYQFEFEDDETIRTFQYNINDFLDKYITNRSCDEISATVYASEYDKQQHILRVLIKVKFKNVIERIVISIDVVK
jgi:hypothetical protein